MWNFGLVIPALFFRSHCKYGKTIVHRAALTSSKKFSTLQSLHLETNVLKASHNVSPRQLFHVGFKALVSTQGWRHVTTNPPALEPRLTPSVTRGRVNLNYRRSMVAMMTACQGLRTCSADLQHASSNVGLAQSIQEDVPAADKETTTAHLPDDDQRKIVLLQGKGRQARFHSAWLRYNCHCGECKQDHSGQIMLQAHKLSPTFTVKSAHVQDNLLCVQFLEEPDHETRVPVAFLWSHDYSDVARWKASEQRKPQFSQTGPPEMDYDQVLAGPSGKLRWLWDINTVGFSLLHRVPPQDGMVKQVAELIWPVQGTIYGEVFDVVSTPKPINVAYSTAELGFHMDLMYYESPPGLQFLHCLRFDDCVDGGQSKFVDSWAVAEEFRDKHPDDFRVLSRVPATFEKIHFEREHPVYMKYQRPHIVVNQDGEVRAVNWSPPFEGPLFVPEEDVEPYYRAYHRFADLIETSNTKCELRLKQGDLICFNNRRILHGRKEFQLNGGQRHLQGCYINIDDFRRAVEVLSRLHGDGSPARRVGNQCAL